MLKDNIPHFCYSMKQSKDIIDAIQPEIDRINQEVDDMSLDIHILTTRVIERFELDYGIAPDSSKSIDDRIAAIINKKNIKNVLTEKQMDFLVKRNYKSDKFEVVYNNGEYEFNIILRDDKPINDLVPVVNRAKPAHLAFLLSLLIADLKVKIKSNTIIISDLVRRCGTFNCGVNPL